MENENFYTIDEKGTTDLSASKEINEAKEINSLKLEKTDILRLEENVSESFRGVRSCSKPEVHSANALVAMNRWAQAKIFEHRDLRYIRFGHLGGTASWMNHTDWDGKRWCSGSVTVKAYIEFRKI